MVCFPAITVVMQQSGATNHNRQDLKLQALEVMQIEVFCHFVHFYNIITTEMGSSALYKLVLVLL